MRGSIKTELGYVIIETEEENITGISFEKKKTEAEEENELIKSAKQQLVEYFNAERRKFSLPLKMRGTEFQKRVWKALIDIPYGETRSYKEIAEAAGNIKACRATGMANHNNPVGIVVPCHRVIGSDGRLTGYAGGLDIKERLLELEQKGRKIKVFQ
jgi:methylated-DNA-[protein]-cysteine S-methyltransferase